MASVPSSPRLLRPRFFSAIFFFLLLSINPATAVSCYNSIFSFGDSLADTGNYLASDSNNFVGKLPYGETYFHHPSGRFSDGRIMLDFIAQALGLPFVPPFLGKNGTDDFKKGVNFAVGGATALDHDFFRWKGLDVDWTNYTLSAQLDWFKKLLPSLCSSFAECDHLMRSSLFLVGEIGGNDYNHALVQGRTLDEIRTYTPSVVRAIGATITSLIRLGARTLVVPGDFPIGCISMYLAKFQSGNAENYDPTTGCIKWLNEFSEYHNRLLLLELNKLRLLHPGVTIIYADYYRAALSVYRAPYRYGFGDAALSACCGGDGPFNVNLSAQCGTANATVCSDPSKYISWDGMHLTEAAYQVIAAGLLGPFTVPSISTLCPLVNSNVAAWNAQTVFGRMSQ